MPDETRPVDHPQRVPSAPIKIGPNFGDIDNWFVYHAPTDGQIPKYQKLREAGRLVVLVMMEVCPPSADRTAAIRYIRQAIWTANASIACELKKPEDPTLFGD